MEIDELIIIYETQLKNPFYARISVLLRVNRMVTALCFEKSPSSSG